MSTFRTDVKIDLSSLQRFRALLEQGFDMQAGPVQQAFKDWATIYRSFLKERFMRLSRSGGGAEWPPLRLSTIKRRRHAINGRSLGRGAKAFRKAVAAGGGQVSILWDTGTLLASIDPQLNAPGRFEQLVPGGIEVGIGLGGAHPSAAGLTVGELASFHQTGAGRLPARPIIVKPDEATLNRMAQALEIGVAMAKQQAGA